MLVNLRARPRLALALTKPQRVIFEDPSRFRLVLAGRRFGKTYLSRAELVAHAIAHKRSLSVYIAPSRVQAKQLMWDTLKALLPPSMVARKEEVDLKITLVNGSQLLLRGAENETGLRGLGIGLCVLDEAAFMSSTVFSEVVRPALSDTGGRALFITTPRVIGEWFHQLCMEKQGQPDWGYHEYTTLQGGNVPPEEVEASKLDMDERTFKMEYEARWESMTGRVYYAFCGKNVQSLPPLKSGETLHIGIDFNIDPMSAIILVKRGSEVHALDEISIRNGNTQMLAETIKKRYKNPIICYPDPTGASRKTAAAAGDTDHTILRRAGFQVYSPNAAYSVADKLNTVNRAFLDASGNSRLLLQSGVTRGLQKSLSGWAFVEGTSIPEPRSVHSHACDALAYAIMALLPIYGQTRRINIVGL
jgi:hypothetical protein